LISAEFNATLALLYATSTAEVIESESESEDHRQPIPLPIPVAIDGLEPMWQAPLMGNSWPASTENILFMCQIN